MTATSAKAAACLGFLTAIDHADVGIVGGYLVLNALGRPLEFHCTAPLKPTRTQQILFGVALEPYVYGEQVGQALLTKSKLTPVAVCTDRAALLAVRDFCLLPMALVLPSDDSADASARIRPPFSLGKNRLATSMHFGSDEQAILAAWPQQAEALDLLEPFVRIREALEEAQRTARQAA